MSEVDLVQHNEKCVKTIFACARNIGKYLDEDQNSLYSELKSNVEEFCMLDYQRELAQNALSNVKNETDDKNIDNLEQRFQEKLNQLGNSKPKGSHSFIKEFNKLLNDLNSISDDLDDSDIAITQSQNQYIDPITKKEIQNPMKNKICGHVYEKQAILELMSVKKHRTFCPVASCPNRKTISASDLEFDEELKFQLSLKHHSTMVQESIDLDCSM